MKIFVTATTGYLGHAVAAELRGAGHAVDGVALAYRAWQEASEGSGA